MWPHVEIAHYKAQINILNGYCLSRHGILVQYMPMKNACGPFEGKRITVMGLGLLGRGIGDAEFLARCGAKILVTDRKSEEELRNSVMRLRTYRNISFRLGEHREEDFTNCDLVIKAAGVPLDSPFIALAKQKGVQVAMSTALFARSAMAEGATIIGITGTRGKSTVTQMIFEGLRRAGKSVHLGGNVRGVSTLAMLPKIERGDMVVLELDSWQLQGFGELGISPQIAVFTNLMPDHLNYYPDMEAYFNDKAEIFRHQKSGDVLIAGEEIAERIRRVSPPCPPTVPQGIGEWVLRIPGEHNRENAALAAEALRAAGLTDNDVREGIESFEGMEGRLQHMGIVRGADVYNDNNATTPEATIAALQSFPGKKIVLIAGGSDKGLPLENLAHVICQRVAHLILLPGTGSESLRPLVGVPVTVADSLEEAVSRAVDTAGEGAIVLFSPAFASFGLFVHEYDRNDQFVKAIQSAI